MTAERGAHREDDEGAADDPPFKPLTAQEAQAWRANHPQVSPWRVVAVQAAVGLIGAALAWILVGRGEAAWSALAGAAVVVLPGALMARGLTRLSGASAGAILAGFWVLEAAKIFLALALLVGLALGARGMHWPAMLATLIACLQVNWWALRWQGRVKT
jgi:ATP synthase protein I